MFSEYSHNIPAIYSILEGQYEGEVYADSKNNPQIAILFTPFAFNFVAGNAEENNAVDVIDEVLFKHYLPKTGQKEAVVFCPNRNWEKVLDIIFGKHHGIKDNRRIYRLNREKFRNVYAGRKVLVDIESKIFYEQDKGAKKQYPISRIIKGNECISFCSGFMIGKGHAEIDVSTNEFYRGKGYAKEAAITLIKELLDSGIEPDWCTWPFRTESQKLALSLGYELTDEVPAHIWVEDECCILE